MFHVINDRELSGSSERHVRKAISSNVQVLQRMCLQRTLQGHMGCVNTCSFDTEAGSILITGSDDQHIILWDWERGLPCLRFDSGHANNVFQARMLPHTGGTRIVTCAADGQVRLAELPEGASSVGVARSLLASHEGRAHKLALDPLNPAHCFYSSGEDGQVIHFDLRCGTGVRQNSSSSSSSSSRSGAWRKLLVCRGYSRARGPTARVVGLNAIHVNPTRPWQFAVGGDDPWARVYDIRKTRDLPNPSLQNPSSSSCSSLAAVAAAAAAAAGFRSSSRSGAAAAAAAAAAAIGPPTRQEARDSRVYAMADEPVARLCTEGLSREGGRGFMGSMSPSITCVMFSQQGELLASYNDEDIYLFSSQASLGSLGGSSSSRDTNSTSAAEQGDSPLRRSCAAAAAAADTGTGVQQQQQQRENTGQQQQEQQHQQQRYYEDEDAERPRWRRRQRLRQSANSAAADPAAAGIDIATEAAGVAMDPCEPAHQPASAAAGDGGGNSTAAAAASSAPVTAASRGVGSPIGAVTDTDDIEMQRGSSSSSRQQQQEQQQQQQGSAGPPACGLGRGFGIPAARFYDLESSSRDGVVASYYGHRNSATVKGVSFFGENDEYVMSGSDCGHVYIWSKYGGEIVWWQAGDDEVVNCLEPHPLMPHVLATSGIEHDVKIWAPTASKPSPPPPASLRATMAANKRDRQTQRQAMTEPEQWLLQLLAAQRRRAAAAAHRRAPGSREGAAEVVDVATTSAAARVGAEEARPPSGYAERNIADVEELGAQGDPMDDEDADDDDDDDPDVDKVDDEDDAGVFARFVLPGGGRVVRVRLAGRRRRGRDGGAGAESGEERVGQAEDSSDAEAHDEDSDGGEGDDRPCYVS